MAAVLACTALPAFAPANAQAADVGFCATPAEMTKILKAEGQRSLASGNQKILFEEKPDGTIVEAEKTVGLIFTADKDGKIGYVLQADTPIGTPASKFCVADRMHHVRLYDVRKDGPPRPETLLRSTREKAAEQCDALAAAGRISRDACGFHNDMLTNLSKAGDRVMLQGLGVDKQEDGSWKPDGSIITITANMTGDGTSRDGRGIIQYSYLPGGASRLASVFTGTSYTPTALAELDP